MDPVRLFWGRRNKPEHEIFEEARDWWVGQDGRLMKDWAHCDYELLLAPFVESTCMFPSQRGGDWALVPRGVSFPDRSGGRNSVYFQRFHLCENSQKSFPTDIHGIVETVPCAYLFGPSREKDLAPVSVMVVGPYTPSQSQGLLYKTVLDVSRWDWSRIQKAFGDELPELALPRVCSDDFPDRMAGKPDASLLGMPLLNDARYSQLKVKPLATYMIPPGDAVSAEFIAHSANGLVHLTDSNAFDPFEGVNDFVSFLHAERSDYIQVLVSEFGRMLSNLKRPPADFMIELSGYFTEKETSMTDLDSKRYLILCHKDDEAVYEHTGLVLGTPIAGTDAPGSKPMLSSAYKSVKYLGRMPDLAQFPSASQKVFTSLARATRSNALSPEEAYQPLESYVRQGCGERP